MSVRVIITDGEERAVLGACRGLAAAGYRVSAVARERPAATHWSRSCSERFVLPDPRVSVQAFVAGLEKLVDQGDVTAMRNVVARAGDVSRAIVRGVGRGVDQPADS